MEFTKFSGKSVEAALEEAAAAFQVSSDNLEYEILDEGSVGFLGFGSKPAMIQARKKFTLTGSAEDFLKDVFRTMNMEVELETVYNEEEKTMDITIEVLDKNDQVLIKKYLPDVHFRINQVTKATGAVFTPGLTTLTFTLNTTWLPEEEYNF